MKCHVGESQICTPRIRTETEVLFTLRFLEEAEVLFTLPFLRTNQRFKKNTNLRWSFPDKVLRLFGKTYAPTQASARKGLQGTNGPKLPQRTGLHLQAQTSFQRKDLQGHGEASPRKGLHTRGHTSFQQKDLQGSFAAIHYRIRDAFARGLAALAALATVPLPLPSLFSFSYVSFFSSAPKHLTRP